MVICKFYIKFLKININLISDLFLDDNLKRFITFTHTLEIDGRDIRLVSLLAIFIIPRTLRKRMKNESQATIQEKRQIFQPNKYNYSRSQIESASSKLSDKNMLVLGELIRGSKTFENLQKKYGPRK